MQTNLTKKEKQVTEQSAQIDHLQKQIQTLNDANKKDQSALLKESKGQSQLSDKILAQEKELLQLKSELMEAKKAKPAEKGYAFGSTFDKKEEKPKSAAVRDVSVEKTEVKKEEKKAVVADPVKKPEPKKEEVKKEQPKPVAEKP